MNEECRNCGGSTRMRTPGIQRCEVCGSTQGVRVDVESQPTKPEVVSRASGSSAVLHTCATLGEAVSIRDRVEVTWKVPHEVVVVERTQ